MPRTVIGFIILTLSLPVFGQTKPAKIRFADLFADSDYQRIIDDLIEVRKRDRDYFRRENFDYLMARASESAGQLSSSAASYQSVVERDSELRPYALKHLATLMHKTGNLGMERLFLDEIRYSSKESIPRLVANERLLRNLFESSDFEGVILALTKGTARLEFELLDNGRNALVILGNAYLRLGRVEDARSVFRKLLDEDPNESQPDDNSLAAVRGLDQIDYPKGIKKNTDTLPASEHKRRADIFQFNRDFESARSHYDAILRNPETSLNAFALYQIGRGFDQERNYSEAVPQFLKIRVDYPKDPLSGRRFTPSRVLTQIWTVPMQQFRPTASLLLNIRNQRILNGRT